MKLQEIKLQEWGRMGRAADPMKWTYKGKKFEYTGENVGDEDTDKLWHEVSVDGAKPVHVDFSPNSTISRAEIELWYDLGMPTRKDVGSIGPMRMDDLKKLAKQKNI